MAFFQRYRSAPQLQKISDNASITLEPQIPTGGEYTEDDDEEVPGKNNDKNTDVSNRRLKLSGSASNLSSATEMLPGSESGVCSKVNLRKNSTSQDYDGSPAIAQRHSYGCDLDTLSFRTSTEIKSAASESKLFYHTSTDSDSNVPIYLKGSNFPGELLGVDNAHTQSPTNDTTLAQSPRSRSRLNRLREAFRSPQIGRRKASKDKSDEEKSPRLRKAKSTESGTFVKLKKPKSEDGSKSPGTKKSGSIETIPEMSSWVIALGFSDLELDQEFEVSLQQY